MSHARSLVDRLAACNRLFPIDKARLAWATGAMSGALMVRMRYASPRIAVICKRATEDWDRASAVAISSLVESAKVYTF